VNVLEDNYFTVFSNGCKIRTLLWVLVQMIDWSGNLCPNIRNDLQHGRDVKPYSLCSISIGWWKNVF